MSEHYENLPGATGRARFFRPERHAARKLFAGAPPSVWFDDREFLLDNISATGAGCRTRDFLPEEMAIEGDGRGVLRLTQFGREIFSARARMARTGLDKGSLIVGLALDNASFPLNDLIRKNAGALAYGLADAEIDRSQPSNEYKSFCADILSFIGGYLEHIDRHLTPIEDKLDPVAVDEIIMELMDGATPSWRLLLEEGNDLVLPLHKDKAARNQLKQYTERVITRKLTGGESWARSYFKPMGYPGDFRIMNFMYDGVPEGDGMHAKFLHMLGVVAGRPIVTRMEALADLILDHARERQSAQTDFKIMSIGSGPARELEPLVKGSGGLSWHATLVDQESEALNYALDRAANMDAGGALKVSALNISFRDMLNATPLRAHLIEQDIIYSSGLVDYLNPLLAMRFVRRMFEFLKPGQRQFSVLVFQDLFGQGKPKPDAFHAAGFDVFGLGERGEGGGDLFFAHAAAMIDDIQLVSAFSVQSAGYFDEGVRFGSDNGVVQQLPDSVGRVQMVDVQHRVFSLTGVERYFCMFGCRARLFNNGLHQIVYRTVHHVIGNLASGCIGIAQHFADGRQKPGGGRVDFVKIIAWVGSRIVRDLVFDDFGKPDNLMQRRSQLVTQNGQEADFCTIGRRRFNQQFLNESGVQFSLPPLMIINPRTRFLNEARYECG
ncbi:Uncharacterized protein SCF082_LOCUS24122 [Durusdinium trenchii]|uniref:Uncharacterized protein n=1 Tax=Durusdinium trenchii TaxID=1381693 RepID=A0ABP0LK62_9DINO